LAGTGTRAEDINKHNKALPNTVPWYLAAKANDLRTPKRERKKNV
jgi:hypothetical protein